MAAETAWVFSVNCAPEEMSCSNSSVAYQDMEEGAVDRGSSVSPKWLMHKFCYDIMFERLDLLYRPFAQQLSVMAHPIFLVDRRAVGFTISNSRH